MGSKLLPRTPQTREGIFVRVKGLLFYIIVIIANLFAIIMIIIIMRRLLFLLLIIKYCSCTIVSQNSHSCVLLYRCYRYRYVEPLIVGEIFITICTNICRYS